MRKGNHKRTKEAKEKGFRKFELVDGSFRGWAPTSGAPGGVGELLQALESEGGSSETP